MEHKNGSMFLVICALWNFTLVPHCSQLFLPATKMCIMLRYPDGKREEASFPSTASIHVSSLHCHKNFESFLSLACFIGVTMFLNTHFRHFSSMLHPKVSQPVVMSLSHIFLGVIFQISKVLP